MKMSNKVCQMCKRGDKPVDGFHLKVHNPKIPLPGVSNLEWIPCKSASVPDIESDAKVAWQEENDLIIEDSADPQHRLRDGFYAGFVAAKAREG